MVQSDCRCRLELGSDTIGEGTLSRYSMMESIVWKEEPLGLGADFAFASPSVDAVTSQMNVECIWVVPITAGLNFVELGAHVKPQHGMPEVKLGARDTWINLCHMKHWKAIGRYAKVKTKDAD